MPPLDRDDIHIISRNSNWSAPGVHKALKDHVYNDKPAWQQFLKLLFISLGIGFTMAGIVFFFAYNWDSLHKFVKIGLIEGLVIALILVIIFSKINHTVKNILLTGASILMGVLMAVFGQVYQTGANAYDLFLGWTLAITAWVIVANFAPLWLVFITLINSTIILYAQQVANNWTDVLIFLLLFLLNSIFLSGALLLAKYKPAARQPSWLLIILALAAVTMATLGMIAGIIGNEGSPAILVLVLAIAIIYAMAFRYGLQQKSLFYLAVISFSIIVIISTVLVDLSDDAPMLLFTFLFIIGSTAFLVKKLIDTQKKWAYEASA